MPITVLLVDDAPDVLETYSFMLETIGYQTICVNSGFKALEIMESESVDLLLTDIAMPDMDGYELYGKTRDLFPHIPIIMMTGFGYDPNHTIVKARKNGLRKVIFKPFDMEQIQEAIQSSLAKAKDD